jgi:cytoskeletal protein RodZ
MVTLADLRARNVQPAWQEAVAVVQELVQTINSTGAGLPDLDHVALIPNGDVVVLPGSLAPDEPVRHAALMLQGLVEGAPTPPELALFIERNVSTPAQSATLADFARNLSFYERPGRRADVERLVARAVAVAQNTRAEEELRRLKERTVENQDRRLEETVFSDTVAMTDRGRPVLAIAGVLLALVLLVGGWWWWQRARAPQAPVAATSAETSAPGAAGATDAAGSGATSAADATGAAVPAGTAAPAGTTAPAGTPGGTAAGATGAVGTATAGAPAKPEPSLIDRAAAAVKSTVDKVMGTPAAPAPVAAAPPPPPPPAPPKKHRKPAPPVKEAPAVAAVAPAVASTPAPAAPSAPAPVVLAAPPVDDAVYTMADAAVIPPVLVRPVIPKEPPAGVPEDQIGTIDVLVDEQGDVETVRLRSPGNRYQERMLVSAAKMWKFRPAFKDGHPVRYRTRVRLTV